MAVHLTTENVRNKVAAVAGSMLEVDPSDIVIEEFGVPAGAPATQ